MACEPGLSMLKIEGPFTLGPATTIVLTEPPVSSLSAGLFLRGVWYGAGPGKYAVVAGALDQRFRSGQPKSDMLDESLRIWSVSPAKNGFLSFCETTRGA